MTADYYIDPEMVEHGCCWDTAIVRKCEMGEGMYCKGVKVCNEDYAQIICDALNATKQEGEI